MVDFLVTDVGRQVLERHEQIAAQPLEDTAGGAYTHDAVASAVRMLMRGDLHHEAICTMARDRIVWLAGQVDALQRAKSRQHDLILAQGCSCVDVEMGSYANQVELATPAHMLELGSVGCLEFRSTTCVDRCLAPLVQALWAAGVVTTGCCCGHNKTFGYVGIHRHG